MSHLQQVKDRGRNGFRIRYTSQGRSRSISLSGVDEQAALTWKAHVDHLVTIKESGGIVGKSTIAWIASLPEKMRSKLEAVELVEPMQKPEEPAKVITLSGFMEGYFGSKQRETKPATWTFYQHTRKRLVEYFGESKPISEITPADAREFRKWLESSNKRDKGKEGKPAKPLAINTIKRRSGLCRQVFAQAVQDGIIQRNPFVGMTVSVRSNKERQHYVPLDVFAKVLEKAPNARWRALLVLARLGAFRIPSEAQGLKWEHIAWEAKRISIVASSKTEHHEKRQIRIVPLLPAIERELLKVFSDPNADSVFVFPGMTGETNLRTTLEKIIARAGVKQWPKLWQNLRASACTDFAKSNPSHVAAAICGHTEQVAKEHYWTVTESDMELAISTAPTLPEVGGQIGGHLVGNSSHLEATGVEQRTLVLSGNFANPCGICDGIVGEEGLESPQESQGKHCSCHSRPISRPNAGCVTGIGPVLESIKAAFESSTAPQREALLEALYALLKSKPAKTSTLS